MSVISDHLLLKTHIKVNIINRTFKKKLFDKKMLIKTNQRNFLEFYSFKSLNFCDNYYGYCQFKKDLKISKSRQEPDSLSAAWLKNK